VFQSQRTNNLDSWKELVGRALPSLELLSSPGPVANLASMSRSSSLVVCVAPGVGSCQAGPGDVDVSTARACMWRRHVRELARMGYKLIWVSECPTDMQQEWAEREELGYLVLSDETLVLSRVLGLPLQETVVGWAYEHLTLVVRKGEIVQVFRPEGPPWDAQGVVAWISRTGASRIDEGRGRF
jgi:peroxiredoxin